MFSRVKYRYVREVTRNHLDFEFLNKKGEIVDDDLTSAAYLQYLWCDIISSGWRQFQKMMYIMRYIERIG
jgi:hypothetical protein